MNVSSEISTQSKAPHTDILITSKPQLISCKLIVNCFEITVLWCVQCFNSKLSNLLFILHQIQHKRLLPWYQNYYPHNDKSTHSAYICHLQSLNKYALSTFKDNSGIWLRPQHRVSLSIAKHQKISYNGAYRAKLWMEKNDLNLRQTSANARNLCFVILFWCFCVVYMMLESMERQNCRLRIFLLLFFPLSFICSIIFLFVGFYSTFLEESIGMCVYRFSQILSSFFGGNSLWHFRNFVNVNFAFYSSALPIWGQD